MDRIASFSVDHSVLEPGIYLSRRDVDPQTAAIVSTFDLRMCAPNREPVIDTAAMHAIEHLGATFLRNDQQWKNYIVYFGPMGCRTGFYLILFGDLGPLDIKALVIDMFEYIENYEGKIPGATPFECGNYHDSDLGQAKWWAQRYLNKTLYHLSESHMTYPQLLK